MTRAARARRPAPRTRARARFAGPRFATALVGGAVLLTSGCGQQDAPLDGGPAPLPPPSWEPVLERALEASAADGLPVPTEEQRLEVVELLDLATLDERSYERAWRRFAELDPSMRTAALLDLVESRETEAALVPWAYAALRDHGTMALLPRLTLRLKYEKNWLANVPLAVALLQRGSGAGLAALETILSTEDAPQEVRAAAAEALQLLPPAEGWTPGAEFAADWARLLEVRAHWLRHRALPGQALAEFDPALTAACWRMLAQYRSQPLRPVDDARRVFERLPLPAIDLLVEVTHDENRYVREHALQTLSWIGAPVGERMRAVGVDLKAALLPLLSDSFNRARAVETLGATGADGAEDALLPFLQDRSYDVVTATADALLRCGSESVVPEVSARLQSEAPLSPEARYSLGCLLTLHSGAPPPTDADLDPSERARRLAWLDARRGEVE